jgi:hypothetical protein
MHPLPTSPPALPPDCCCCCCYYMGCLHSNEGVSKPSSAPLPPFTSTSTPAPAAAMASLPPALHCCLAMVGPSVLDCDMVSSESLKTLKASFAQVYIYTDLYIGVSVWRCGLLLGPQSIRTSKQCGFAWEMHALLADSAIASLRIQFLHSFLPLCACLLMNHTCLPASLHLPAHTGWCRNSGRNKANTFTMVVYAT